MTQYKCIVCDHTFEHDAQDTCPVCSECHSIHANELTDDTTTEETPAVSHPLQTVPTEEGADAATLEPSVGSDYIRANIEGTSGPTAIGKYIIQTTGDVIGRDKHVHGDEVRGDKVLGDQVRIDQVQIFPEGEKSITLQAPPPPATFYHVPSTRSGHK